MMPPELLHLGIRIGVFVTLLAGLLVVTLEAGTPEHTISIVMAGIGSLFLGTLTLLSRR